MFHLHPVYLAFGLSGGVIGAILMYVADGLGKEVYDSNDRFVVMLSSLVGGALSALMFCSRIDATSDWIGDIAGAILGIGICLAIAASVIGYRVPSWLRSLGRRIELRRSLSTQRQKAGLAR
ncbi:MAG TPA: hypothetical protein V6C81_12200 [Planktothrix sp.]|jgi:hypothetical protein